MKNFVLFFLLTFFISCSNDKTDENASEDYHGKWKLVKMTGPMPNSVTTGNAMAWQEYYEFKDNWTFTKTRIKDNVTVSVWGTYTTQNISETLYLRLTFSNDTKSTISSCFGSLKEELYFSSKNTLTNTWLHCDGLGLDYQKE